MRMIRICCINPDCLQCEAEYKPIYEPYYADSFTCTTCGWKLQVERVDEEKVGGGTKT